jgi:hypothetical protein
LILSKTTAVVLIGTTLFGSALFGLLEATLFAASDYSPVWNALIAAVLAVVMALIQIWKEGRDKDRALKIKDTPLTC